MASCTETESNGDNHADATDSFLLLSYLDEVEDRVETLRRHAIALLQERESLLTVLSQLRDESSKGAISEGESEEIRLNIERLQKRCRSVEIHVHTLRNPEQEASYSKVDSLVKELEHTCVLGDPDSDTYRVQAKSFLNACVSDAAVHGPIDYKFQGMILGCKLEDQKLVRHRLECLVKGRCHANFMDELETLSPSAVPEEKLQENNCNSSQNSAQHAESSGDQCDGSVKQDNAGSSGVTASVSKPTNA